jgi:hypothetical protein
VGVPGEVVMHVYYVMLLCMLYQPTCYEVHFPMLKKDSATLCAYMLREPVEQPTTEYEMIGQECRVENRQDQYYIERPRPFRRNSRQH